ncbi:MAG: DUF1543 domain-containing protein [Deltaproteobacteria bacterium]|nr:DUF1543 domain-containing protein [Deltaproteobacteria bacterium]
MEPSTQKLFAVYLGGKAPKSNTELHDVVFVIGESIEATYEQLMDKWFGTPEGLHLDSWIELSVIDGHRITLSAKPQAGEKKLFFINLGAYLPGQFTEVHANTFVVAKDEREVKSRAKSELLKGFHSVHTDNLYEVDDCLEISEVGGLSVSLEPTEDRVAWEPNNGYHIIPKPLVQAYMEKKGIPSLAAA